MGSAQRLINGNTLINWGTLMGEINGAVITEVDYEKNILLELHFPVHNNYKVRKNLKKYPTIISQCKNCLLIQLKYSVPDKLLFPDDYSYLSSNSKEKIDNFSSIFSKIKKLSRKKSPKILDIGCNDGSFLKLVKKKYSKVLGIEPTKAAKISVSRGINTIKKPLNYNLAKNILNKYSKFDFIIASNFFAQTNNLIEIKNSIKLILDKNGELNILDITNMVAIIMSTEI